MNIENLIKGPEDIPEFRKGVILFIEQYLRRFGVSTIIFEKNEVTGKWDYDCDISLCKFDADDVNKAIEWFCSHLERYSITYYSLTEAESDRWDSICISDVEEWVK